VGRRCGFMLNYFDHLLIHWNYRDELTVIRTAVMNVCCIGAALQRRSYFWDTLIFVEQKSQRIIEESKMAA